MKKITAIFVMIFICLHFSAFAENNKEITRIEFVSYVMSNVGIMNSEEEPGFSDISKTDRYYKYAAAAKEHGVVKGYSDGSFKPYDKITRQEAAVILSRAYRIESTDRFIIEGFSDYNSISEYARENISALVQNGIIPYREGNAFRPKELVNLDEMEQLVTKCSGFLNSTMHFNFGYPREAERRNYGAITLSIKISRPGRVYYKMMPTDGYLKGFKPTPQMVNVFLTDINRVDIAAEVEIRPEDWENYDLYIVAEDRKGNFTKVEKIERVSAHRYTLGSGKKNDPYRIYNAEQLKGIENYPDAHFRLEEDIEITEQWKPIRIEDKGFLGFSGTLDGNYHKITGLKVKSYNKNAGLFESLYGGRVARLYLDGDVDGTENVGLIAGISEGGSVNECFVTGTVEASGNNAGGILGSNNGIVENSVSAAYMVHARMNAGGIAGANRGDILNSLAAVYSVSADMYASAAAGVNVGGRISRNVCAGMYADDVITAKSGRVTTNKQQGRTSNNYCYDKMVSDSSVNFAEDSHDGLEVSWEELTSLDFYKNVMGWDTKNIWNGVFGADFRLISLKGFKDIDMVKGLTIYAPIKIYTMEDLKKVGENLEYHYILMKDISAKSGELWSPIAGNADAETGFNGTFDGNNHTVSGLYIANGNDNKFGLFGVISAGSVRNLRLSNVIIEGHTLAGGIAAENYGIIENCSVSGRIYAEGKSNTVSAGGVCGNNYGQMENIASTVKIHGEGQALTIGGITAGNDGVINNADYAGKIYTEKDIANSNAVIGGIGGMNNSGMIYNSSAEAEITSRAVVNYLGGISGIVNGGEVYKAHSFGEIEVKSGENKDSTAYIGGVCGLIPAGLIINSYSLDDITVKADKIYAGGIVGYNQTASVQNCYTRGELEIFAGDENSQSYTAGICGYSEEGFIFDNVVLLEKMITTGFAAKVCNIGSQLVSCENNFSLFDFEFSGALSEKSNDGEEVDEKTVKNREFFFKPIAEGGVLGWSEGDVWEMKEGSYPILKK